MYDSQTPILIVGEGVHLGQLVMLAELASNQVSLKEITSEGGKLKRFIQLAGLTGRGQLRQLAYTVRNVLPKHAIHVPEPSNPLAPNTMVIGGTTGLDGLFHFPPEKTGWFLFNKRWRIHHPIVFADLVPLDFSGRIVSCGYPGSGNGLLQAILENLRAISPSQLEHKATSLVSAYAANYLQHYEKFQKGLAERLDADNYAMSTSFSIWSHQERQSLLAGVNVRNYLFETQHKTHEPLGNKITLLCKQGAKGFLSVRDPLDVLVSIANKMGRLGVDMLSSEQLFREVVRGMVSYYRGFMPATDSGGYITMVRYEGILRAFEQEVDRLASCLGIPCADEQVQAIKEKLLYKPLAHPGHMWKPGVGKWRQYLSARHIAILHEEGMEQVSSDLGYGFPEGPVSAHTQNITPVSFNQGILPRIFAFLSRCKIDQETALRLAKEYGDIYQYEISDALFLASSRQAVQCFSRFAKETDFPDFIASGAYDPCPRFC